MNISSSAIIFIVLGLFLIYNSNNLKSTNNLDNTSDKLNTSSEKCDQKTDEIYNYNFKTSNLELSVY